MLEALTPELSIDDALGKVLGVASALFDGAGVTFYFPADGNKLVGANWRQDGPAGVLEPLKGAARSAAADAKPAWMPEPERLAGPVLGDADDVVAVLELSAPKRAFAKPHEAALALFCAELGSVLRSKRAEAEFLRGSARYVASAVIGGPPKLEILTLRVSPPADAYEEPPEPASAADAAASSQKTKKKKEKHPHKAKAKKRGAHDESELAGASAALRTSAETESKTPAVPSSRAARRGRSPAGTRASRTRTSTRSWPASWRSTARRSSRSSGKASRRL